MQRMSGQVLKEADLVFKYTNIKNFLFITHFHLLDTKYDEFIILEFDNNYDIY